MSNKLTELEDRVFDLEFKELKKLVQNTRRFLITPKASAKPEISPVGLTISSKRRAGNTSYSVRYASGAVTNLPSDRKSWPADIRAMVEKIEVMDKQRMVGGRMISSAGGSCKIV
jgi:hypothetical protein